MNESLLGLVLDGLVLVFLGATIMYAARLSKHLKNFRDGRKDLEKLIGDLSTQIMKAENSIEELKTSARDISRELQSQLDEARAMGDDLEIMTRGANNMADRLDKAADRHRGSVNEPAMPQQQRNVRKPTPEEFPGFAIRDNEAEHGFSDDEEGSLAERELLEALQSRKGHR
jgi:hypothetical protein